MMNNGIYKNGLNKFEYIKSLVNEYNSNKELIDKLTNEKYFLAIGYTYDSMEGEEKRFDIIDKKYSDQLIKTLTNRNKDIEDIINE